MNLREKHPGNNLTSARSHLKLRPVAAVEFFAGGCHGKAIQRPESPVSGFSDFR